MHSVEGWPSDVTVAEPAAEVWVNGLQRDTVEVSLTKNLGDTLSGGDGLIAATGDVVLKPVRDDVGTRQLTPWSPLALRAGHGVAVELGYKGALAPNFVGVADGDAGGVGENLTLPVVDDFDQLNKTITLDPLMATMPPWYEDGGYRRIGITPTFVTSHILRLCGYYATPPTRGGTMLSATLNGSAWPDVGRIISCNASGGLPTFDAAPWGQSSRGVVARYELIDTANIGAPIEIQCLVGNAGSVGNAHIDVVWSNGDYIRLLVTPTRAVYFAERRGGTSTNVAIFSSGQMAGAERVVARASQSGTWTLTADNGQSTTVSRSFTKTTKPSHVDLSIPSQAAQIGGVLVGAHHTFAPTFVRSADLGVSAHPGSLTAIPSIIRQKASDVLREQAAAELAAIWLDDQGIVRWRNRYQLVTGSPVKTLTSKESLLGLSWRTPTRHTAKSVVVTGRRPQTSRAPMSTITVYEGRKDTLASGQQLSVFMEASNDEDWVMPDTGAEWIDQTADRVGGFNRGRRSWVGMVRVRPDANGDPIETWVPGDDLVYEQIDPKTFVCTLTAPSLASNETAELRSHSEDTVIFPQYRNTGLPLLRCYGLIQWLDVSFEHSSGINGAPEYKHDVSWFVQGDTMRNRVAQAVAERVNNPQPVLDDVPIVPDARLELADIITLQDPDITGLDLRCLIEGIKISAAEGEQNMSLSLRILEVNGVQATYEELEQVWQEATYTQFENHWAGSTYQQFEDDPLRKD